MNKDKEIIAILTDQLGLANATIATLTARVAELSASVKQMSETIARRDRDDKAKDEFIAQLMDEIKKLQTLVRLLGGKKSEKVTEEEMEDGKVGSKPKDGSGERAKNKSREHTNNGAKRDPHIECETETVHIYPDDPNFDKDKAFEIGTRECTRFVLIPMKFKKIIYIIHSFRQGNEVFNGDTPFNAINKSNYDESFVAGLAQLRFCYNMTVERTLKYMNDCGFDLDKSTAHHLLRRGSSVIENLYKALGLAIKEDTFFNIDESFHTVLEENSKTGKCSIKGYIWAAESFHSQLAYFFYDKGSRRQEVGQEFIEGYKGAFQSDGLAFYRKLGSAAYPNIKRLPCLQHIKRRFKNEGSKEGMSVFNLLNKLYRQDHKHKIGEDGWTEEQHLRWRKEYSPSILKETKDRIDDLEILTKDDPARKELREAVVYAINEWPDVKNIFTEGYYTLDNNAIERLQRCISLSRRNSLFFGSHTGAQRAAMYYSLTCSCDLHGINFFDYFCDILNRCAQLSPNTPMSVYREMLPDKWAPRIKTE